MPINTCIKWFSFVLVAFWLVGCSAVKVTPNCTYMIDALPPCVPCRPDDSTTIMVLQPETVPVYDTTQMAYARCKFQIAYYAKNQWAETPAQMLQPLIVKTLLNTHHYHGVVTAPFVGNYDYSLNTQILELLQDYSSPCHPVVRLMVHAQINGVTTSEVIAAKDFVICVPMCHHTPYGGVLAANLATEIFLQQLAEFCVRKT